MIKASPNINTSPMVVLRPSTRASDSRAIHLELNELLFAAADARNAIVMEQHLPHSELDQGRSVFAGLAGERQAAVNTEAP